MFKKPIEQSCLFVLLSFPRNLNSPWNQWSSTQMESFKLLFRDVILLLGIDFLLFYHQNPHQATPGQNIFLLSSVFSCLRQIQVIYVRLNLTFQTFDTTLFVWFQLPTFKTFSTINLVPFIYRIFHVFKIVLISTIICQFKFK